MSQRKPDEQDIQRLLIQLHDELERTQTLDENERATMRHLMDDIQAMLNKTDQAGGARIFPAPGEDEDSSGLIDRLEESVSQLEVSHPTLTAMIEKAIETLNIAGI